MSKGNTKPAALPEKATFFLMKKLLARYVFPHARLLWMALFFMMIAAAMTASIAQLMQPVLDDVLSGGKQNAIIPVGIAVFVTFLVRGIVTYAHVVTLNKVGQLVIAGIQKDLFGHFMTLDLAFFHANPSGQLISRVINDVNVVRNAISESVTGVGKSFVTLVFLAGVMVYQDWQLSLAAFTVVPFAAGFVVYLGRRLRKLSGRLQDETAKLSDRLSQIFQGIRQVQAYGMQDRENLRAGEAIDRVRTLSAKTIRLGNLSTPVNETLVGLVAGGIIIYGGYRASDGTMSVGQLAAFLAAFTMAYEPMKKLARLNYIVQMGMGAAERVFGLMDIQPQIVDAPDAVSVTMDRPEIVFDNVSFCYENTEAKALRDISFTAPAGKVVALVGPSGGGKSTIMNLILRFYDTRQGTVSVGGMDVRRIKLSSLRGNIALVSQDITIFDDTVLSNIGYGRPGASEAEIMDAARRAAAHDFITALPEGYQTRLGEDGVMLSGGQRQRISIARALLRDAPLLLLDEATSALDNESEQAVQAALQALEKGRTTIVIAHRLSTVQNADLILVLDRGRIVERGTHAELVAAGGLYARMASAGLKE